MGISYIIAGFIFFFLPNFSIVDILPDFIGCILIIKGLSKLSDLTPGLADAKKAFLNVMYVHIVKFFLMFTVPYFGNTDGGYILIFSFCFAVLDFVFTLPAFKALLNGFLYLGNRTTSRSLFTNQNELSALTTVFIIVKAVMATIPDLAYISNPEHSGVVSSRDGFYLSNYKTLLVGINFLITGIVGVFWIYSAIRYLNGIKKDRQLMAQLTEQYKTTVLPNKGLFIRRSVKNAFAFISIAGFIMTDLLIDLVNVIPDFFGALFFVIAAVTLKKYVDSKLFNVTSVIFLVISTLSWCALCFYAIKFPAVNIWSNIEAYELFKTVNLFNILKYISLMFLFYSIHKTVKSIITTHTGSPVDELETISRMRKKQQQELKTKNTAIFIFGLVCCASGIARMILLYQLPEFNVVDSALNLLYVVYLIKLLNSTYEAVEYRYL